MSLENLELDPNVEVFKPPLEYVTHEEFTMSMEQEANRKLKAEIRRKKRLNHYSLTAKECYEQV